VKGRINSVMLLVSLGALGLASARLVTGLGLESVDPVSKAAFAATPVPAAAISRDGPDPDDAAGAAREWSAAFGREVEPQVTPRAEPEPAVVAAPEPDPEPVAEPAPPAAEPEPEESTQYWLTGLIRDGKDSVALVHDGMEEQVAMPGTHLSGGETVIEIGADSVLVRRDEETVRIVFRDDPAQAADLSGAEGMNDEDWGDDERVED